MLIGNITFEDGLDISPRQNENEEFHYEKDSRWVEHYVNDELFALYNIKYIKEMIILQEARIVALPKEEVKPKALEPGFIIEYPPEPKACEICTCEDVPNPNCPVHYEGILK